MLLQDKFKNKNIILGSQSPRRQELLEGLGLKFKSYPLNTEENYPSELKEYQITEYLSKKKANSYPNLNENDVLITSDTIVWFNGKPLEKPLNRIEAKEMLLELSGNTHQVFTSITIKSLSKEITFSDMTKVIFSKLSAEEIYYYIDTHQPLDKAGAYGIQEWIGYIAVEKIEGSYFNVMGLPTQLLYKNLNEF